jgi:hypothetical protein
MALRIEALLDAALSALNQHQQHQLQRKTATRCMLMYRKSCG